MGLRLTLVTHGGIAAPLRAPPLVVDAEALPAAQRAELTRLLAAAEAAASSRPGPAGGPAPRRRPDAQSYVIQIEDDGPARSLRGDDLTSDASFDALHDWIVRRARA